MSTSVNLRAAPHVAEVGRTTLVSRQGRHAGTVTQAGREPKVLRPLVLPRQLLPRLGSAGFFGLALLLLSIFGLVYITQISYVARYGYQLSSMQRQQAKLDSENQLLEYRISSERTLPRAADIAGHDYGMQPFAGVPRPANSAANTARGTASGSIASGKPAPQVRFITVQRSPAVTSPLPASPAHATLLDHLWNRIVGIGTASVAAR